MSTRHCRSRRRPLRWLLASVSLAVAAQPTAQAQTAPAAEPAGELVPARSAEPVIVASKPFGESYLLGEMFALLLEARGFAVDRRPGLGATEIAFRALATGAIDVYPEYTGTGLVAVLGERPAGSARDVFLRVSRAFSARWGARWLPPLGFENTYAIAVRRATADSLGVRTLSDLARHGSTLVAGFTPDFIGRDDGLSGLARAYGLAFRDVRSLLQAVKYEALLTGAVDVVDGYSTDGMLARSDLVVLADDRAFFPPYEASALVGRGVAQGRPDVIAALSELSGRIDVERMRRYNRRVEVEGASIDEVAAGALAELGLAGATAGADATADAVGASEDSLAGYLWARRHALLRLTLRHLLLVAIALGAAIVVAVPLGVLLERTPRAAESIVRTVGLLQVIPGIALLAFMIPLLGIGVVPALVALFLYTLYPVVRNTYTGVRDADPNAVAAAEALGMTAGQRLVHVRLPLATPTIMAGVRTAAVIAVGTATLAAFIGAGGLGDPIVAGLALSDARMVLSGAVPAALLALAVDGTLALVERLVRPGGLPRRPPT